MKTPVLIALVSASGLASAQFIAGDSFNFTITSDNADGTLTDVLYDGSVDYSGDGDAGNGLELAGIITGGPTGRDLAVFADTFMVDADTFQIEVAALAVDSLGNFSDLIPSDFVGTNVGLVTQLSSFFGLDLDPSVPEIFADDGIAVDFDFGPGIDSISVVAGSEFSDVVGIGGAGSLTGGAGLTPTVGFFGEPEFAGIQFGVGAGGGNLAGFGIGGVVFSSQFDIEFIPTPGAAAVFGLGGLALARRRRA